MYINVVLKHFACGGALVSAASLLTDVGMVSALTQSNATSARSLRPDFDPTLAVQRAMTATADGDDDGDENRSNSFIEKLSQAMKSLVRGKLNNRGFKYKRLEAENEVVINSLTSNLPLAPKNPDDYYRDYVSKIEPERLFDDPTFKAWIDMTIHFFTGKYGNNGALGIEFETYDLIIQTLRKHLGADNFTRLLTDSTSPPMKLVEAQLRIWSRLNLDVAEVFKRLQVIRDGKKMLAGWRLLFWKDYVYARKQSPHDKLWEILINSYGFNDVKLVDMLRVPSARYHKLEMMDRLLSTWKTNKYPLANVLHHLRLRQPEIDVWLAVMRTLDQVPSEIFDSSVALDDKIIAKMIGAALLSESSEKVSSGKIALQVLIEKWMRDGLTGKGLFFKLNLEGKKVSLNSSPLATIWKLYTDHLDVAAVRTR